MGWGTSSVREKLSQINIGERLPVLGIVAFSGCSVNAVANLLLSRAGNPTFLLWPASALVELTTAWIVYQVVENARKLTRSNISKQDRRFYAGILVSFVILAFPSLALSVVANTIEFSDVGLGFIFPLLSVACAIGAALPDTVARFEHKKAKVKADAAKAKEANKAEKERKRQEVERNLQAAESARQKRAEDLVSLGAAAETLRQYAETPGMTQAEAAATLGKSERTIRNHLAHLEALGLVRRGSKGIELLEVE